MVSSKELPKALSCTDIKQQWGIPSLKAQQDPEKELMKRKPLQEVKFEKHLLTCDQKGGRKRRLPQEVSSCYSSKPAAEPDIDCKRVDEFREELKKSKVSYLVTKSIHLKQSNIHPNQAKSNLNLSNPPCPLLSTTNESAPGCSTRLSISNRTVEQRSKEWFKERIGKVTSSKAPAVTGLYGRKTFIETWECIKNSKQEPSKHFRNFERGIQFEESAANCFSIESGAKVFECGLFVLGSDNRFASSPDRLFQGESCSEITNFRTSEKIKLTGQCLLEIKTLAEGQSEPLSSVTAAHVCQVQLQMKCTEVEYTILQSYVPESNKSKYFLIAMDDNFINSFLKLCSSFLQLRQSANAIAKNCPQISFEPI